MSKHYILIHDLPWAGPILKRIKGPAIDLSRGRLESITDTFEYLLQVDKKADDPLKFPPVDYHRISGQPLFSSRLRTALSAAGIDNIQYFPTSAIYEPTGQFHDYQVANVIGIIKALDISASRCTIDEDGFIEDFEMMAFDENKIQSVDFFRLFEMPSIIVISEHVANSLNDSNLTGCRIMEPSQWEPGIC